MHKYRDKVRAVQKMRDIESGHVSLLRNMSHKKGPGYAAPVGSTTLTGVVQYIDDLQKKVIKLEFLLEEQPIEDVPEDTWVLVTLTSTIHPEDKAYEVARLDTEYFDTPTWVCQHELEPINLAGYKYTGWRHLPS